MNISNLALGAMLIALPLLSTGCKKPDKSAVAGTGGSTSVTLYPQHHSIAKNLTVCTVYVKYNTQTAPSDRVYDDSAVGFTAGGMIAVTFSGLQNGNYYFFGYGTDTTITPITTPIVGGEAFTISQQGQSLTSPLAISEDYSDPSRPTVK
ncbi:MAG TPA: hypothetical protein VN721_07045 [Flavipsychrobacter sp.]|nr:hypothetical protein [Flavipsychrobacter sp.]